MRGQLQKACLGIRQVMKNSQTVYKIKYIPLKRQIEDVSLDKMSNGARFVHLKCTVDRMANVHSNNFPPEGSHLPDMTPSAATDIQPKFACEKLLSHRLYKKTEVVHIVLGEHRPFIAETCLRAQFLPVRKPRAAKRSRLESVAELVKILPVKQEKL